MKRETLYCESGGPWNSEETLAAAKARAPEIEPEAIVVASTSGSTALQAAKIFKGTGLRILAVLAVLLPCRRQNFGDR